MVSTVAEAIERGRKMAIEVFTEADKDRLRQVLADMADIEKEIGKATAAGIDVAEQRTKLEETKAKLLRLKGVYLPEG